MSVSDFLKKIFSPLMLGNCFGMILTGAVICLCSLWLVNLYTQHGEEVEVPSVCGLDETAARNKLEQLGLKMEVKDTGYIYRAAPLTILEQSIKAGEHVKAGRTIELTINASGPKKIALPDLADNSSRREAEDKLTVLGFKLGATEYIIGDPEWVYGIKVHGQNVPAGTKISVSTPVTLVVGGGGVEEEYNGNDSLDYVLNVPEEEDIIEGETSDAPTSVL